MVMGKNSKKRINNYLSENSSLTTTNLLYESLVLSVCLPATCVYMYMHVWLLILSNTYKNHFQKTWWSHCWHVWKIDQDIVTFDDSKSKSFFFSR